ncbi:MAG: hypothetical protein U9N80_05725, partial [Chloroflexota bacterium]|nr:hypothetical protein [Chloroflexota bacterium]
MMETHPKSTDQREKRGSLIRRIPFLILPLILIPLFSLGIGAFLSSRNLLQDQAASQMVSAAQAQVQVLQEWTDTNEQRLQLGSQRAALREAASDLLRLPSSSSNYRAAQNSARTELDDLRVRQGQTLFSGVLLARSS